MAVDEAYEIMPYKEIVALKKEIEELKGRSGDVSSRDLLNSMARLTKNMDTMIQIFKQAADSMAAEETTAEKLGKSMKPLLDKLDDVVEQNRTIAEGMVAVADILKGPEKDIVKGMKKDYWAPRMDQPTFDIPPAPEALPSFDETSMEPPRMPPRMPPSMGQRTMPPPLNPPMPPPSLPPFEPRKRGLFNR